LPPALGVDLFEGRSHALCMARMFAGAMAGNLNYYGVLALKAALGQLASHPEIDAARIGAAGFCLGGSIVLTWACTDNRLTAIATFYGAAPKPRKAIRRMCPVVGSWPDKDITTKAAGSPPATPTGAATAGSPSAFTAIAMRICWMVSATFPAARSVPTLNGMPVLMGAPMSGPVCWN
jgi:dienelactone hydrolase